MKTQIKEQINKLYSLFKKPPTLDVKNTQQHIHSFGFKQKAITPLRRAVNEVISTGRCAWCSASKAKVQEGLRDNVSRKEYQISALCLDCQCEVFTTVDSANSYQFDTEE